MTEDNETDRRHNVNESADKHRASTKITRGEGTRDQDAINLKARSDDPEEAVDDLNEMIRRAHETAGIARSIQPQGLDGENRRLDFRWVTDESVRLVEQVKTDGGWEDAKTVLHIYIGEDATLRADGDGGDYVEVPNDG